MKRLAIICVLGAFALFRHQGSAQAQGDLYWTDEVSKIMQRSNLDGSGLETIISALPHSWSTIHSAALDPVEGKVYWTSLGESRIYRSDLDGHDVEEVLFVIPGTSLTGLAIDVDHRKMYWCEHGLNQIRRANLDGSDIELVASNINRPFDVEVDSERGYVYWTSSLNKVQRSRLDGSEPVDILTDLSYPLGLAIDANNGRLYVADGSTSSDLIAANLDGTGASILLGGRSAVIDIEVDPDGGKIYWNEVGANDGHSSRMMRADTDGNHVEVLVGGLARSIGIALMSNEFHYQPPYTLDCRNRPSTRVCVKFQDDFIWLVKDPIRGWRSYVDEGRQVSVAIGFNAEYHHILNTRLVKKVVPQETLIQTPSLLSPADLATDVPNEVDLQWTPVANAMRYNIQVAIDSQFANIILRDNVPGTQSRFSAPDQGATYWWRVNAEFGEGTSPFSAAFRFTTEILAPAMPKLLTPLDEAEGVPNIVALRWAPSDHASRYNVDVAKGADLKDLIVRENVPGTQITFEAPEQGTTYWWRVSAEGPGGRSAYSKWFTFRTEVLQPERPQLISPVDGAVGQSNQIQLAWLAAGNADRYDVQVFLDSALTDAVFHDNTPGLASEFFAPIAGRPYYWRVQSFGVGGSASSPVFRFETSPTLGSIVPILDSPEDGALAVSIAPTMTWTAPDPDSTQHYRLQIATNETFDNPTVDSDSVDGLNYQVSALAYDTKYFWRVAGVAVSGAWTYSPYRSFTTVGTPPKIVELISPLDGEEVDGGHYAFSWHGTENVDSYELCIARDSGFVEIDLVQSDISETSIAVDPKLDGGSIHYWRVRATRAGVVGPWSQTRSFTIVVSTATEGEANLPTQFALHQNYPNPFNPSTTIRFDVPETADVSLMVYDALGRRVETLGTWHAAPGSHTASWNAQQAPSGIYFIRMETRGFQQAIRVTLAK